MKFIIFILKFIITVDYFCIYFCINIAKNIVLCSLYFKDYIKDYHNQTNLKILTNHIIMINEVRFKLSNKYFVYPTNKPHLLLLKS